MIDLKLTSVEVKAETRALRCEWNVETIKDIQYHPDIEKRLERMVRDSMRVENIKNIFGE
jgi:hypothetical protein